MSVQIIIAFVVGLIIGLLVAWYYWRQRLGEHGAEVRRLEAVANEKEQSLLGVKTHLTEQEAKVARLKSQVDQKDDAIRELSARLDWRKLTIGQLGETMQERETQIQELTPHAKQAQSRVQELEAALREKDLGFQSLEANLQEKQTSVERLQEQLGQDEETIRDLTAQIRARNESIHELQKTVSEQDDRIRALESDVGVAVTSIPTRTDPIVVDVSVSPDNLKRIEGIGPKISQLLNDAGILTFVQLAAAEIGRLEQILEEAGPRFQLADPTTWPEQARLAADGDWQALNTLQDGLRGGRRERPQTL